VFDNLFLWLYLLIKFNEMILKPAYIPLTLLWLSMLFISCSKLEKSDLASNRIPKIKALNMTSAIEGFPKLSAAYVNSKKNKIDAFYRKNWFSKNKSISFLVAKDGQIIYEKYEGYANIEKKKSITCNTPIHIASVSKVLTATVILKLINAGKLNLDQKVNTILKDFPYPEITVKTLLNHRSGMRNYAYFTSEKGIWDRHKTLTNQDVLDLMISKKIQLEYKTNTRFTYCNTNYAILALIIEKTTNSSYKEAMKTMIFDPLGMKNTFVYDHKNDQDSVTPSYRCSGRKIGYDYLDAVYGDKNIYATPRDLLKFDMARNSPSFLDPKLNAQIYEGYSNEHRGKKNYGLGIRMIQWPTGQEFYFHNGWWHGNMSSYITLKNENVMMVALTNRGYKQVYKTKNLAPLFGDYPFKLSSDDREE